MVNHLFGICFNQGRLVGWISPGGGCVRVGGTVQNILKGSGTEKRGGETKILKGGKLGQGVGALKNGGGGWNPLTNYD